MQDLLIVLKIPRQVMIPLAVLHIEPSGSLEVNPVFNIRHSPLPRNISHLTNPTNTLYTLSQTRNTRVLLGEHSRNLVY